LLGEERDIFIKIIALIHRLWFKYVSIILTVWFVHHDTCATCVFPSGSAVFLLLKIKSSPPVTLPTLVLCRCPNIIASSQRGWVAEIRHPQGRGMSPSMM